MKSKKNPKPCACGCGEMTKGGDFMQGHDQRLLGAIVREAGGVEVVHLIVEKHLGRQITVNPQA